MQKDYKIIPNVKHSACIVDLLSRAGKLEKAEEFINQSNFQQDPILWRALLSACRVHKDIATGQRIANTVINLEPQAAASYILLHNIYTDAGKELAAGKIRNLMKERRVKKEPGLSWIEIGSVVHCFTAGDYSHPKSDEIYQKLNEMLGSYKERGGYGYKCHSEKLAVGLGLMCLPRLAPVRVMKNLRICEECHDTMKYISKMEKRELVIRDAIRFHRFRDGCCSCRDYW